MSKNILFLIIEKILEKKWCFKYGGTCTTCGMKDVKDELKDYSFKEIIKAFESLDFDNDILCEKYIIELKMIYSLITGQGTVYKEEYNFRVLEDKIRNNSPNNSLICSLISSNDKAYWENWREEQKVKEDKEEKLLEERKQHREAVKKLQARDNKLRGSKYQLDLIEDINKLETKEIFEYLANDTEHTIKFYPSSLLSKAENSFSDIDEEILKKILKKLVDVKIKHGPWKWVKNKLIFELLPSEWISTFKV